MQLKLRLAKADDVDSIMNLFMETILQINNKDYNLEQIQAWAAAGKKKSRWLKKIKKQYFLLAVSRKKLVGFASLSQDGCLDYLYVHKDYQSRGIAQKMVTHLFEVAQQSNLKEIKSAVSITARPFFEKQGFISGISEKNKGLIAKRLVLFFC